MTEHSDATISADAKYFVRISNLLFCIRSDLRGDACPFCILLSMANTSEQHDFASRAQSSHAMPSDHSLLNGSMTWDRSCIVDLDTGESYAFDCSIQHPVCSSASHKHDNVCYPSNVVHIIDPVVGIIRSTSTYPIPSPFGSGPRWLALANLANPLFCRHPSAPKLLKTFGAASCEEEARVIAHHEAIECYSQYVFSRTEVACDGYRKIYPREFFQFRENVYSAKRFKHYHNTLDTQWVSAYNAHTQEIAFIPLDYVGYVQDSHSQLTTSGCAAHPCRETAQQGSILELIERDAIMRHWFFKNGIRLGDDFIARLNIGSDITDIVIIDASVFTPFRTFIAYVGKRVSPFGPMLAVGAGCSVISDTALTRAIGEATTVLQVSELAGNMGNVPPPMEDKHCVVTPIDHNSYYRSMARYDSLMHTLRWFPSQAYAATSCEFAEALAVRSDMEIYSVDITPKALSTFVVVFKSVSTKLIPLAFGYGNECIYRSGAVPDGLATDEPHPFS